MIVNKFIKFLGKADYQIDGSIKAFDLLRLLIRRSIWFVRGLLYSFRLKKSGMFLFVGSNVKLRHASKISLGRTVTFEDNVEINALSKKGIILGNNVTIKKNSIIECTGVIRQVGEGLIIGSNVGIAQNAFIQVRGKVEIGSNVMFGPGVSVFSENHTFDDINKNLINQPVKRIGVTIEDNVWVGANVTILDGVRIGEGSVIAAGSVVTKSVEKFSVSGGIPAKLLKIRS